MKPDKVLCCMFLFSFLVVTVNTTATAGRDREHNSCLLHAEELTKRNLLFT